MFYCFLATHTAFSINKIHNDFVIEMTLYVEMSCFAKGKVIIIIVQEEQIWWKCFHKLFLSRRRRLKIPAKIPARFLWIYYNWKIVATLYCPGSVLREGTVQNSSGSSLRLCHVFTRNAYEIVFERKKITFCYNFACYHLCYHFLLLLFMLSFLSAISSNFVLTFFVIVFLIDFIVIAFVWDVVNIFTFFVFPENAGHT